MADIKNIFGGIIGKLKKLFEPLNKILPGSSKVKKYYIWGLIGVFVLIIILIKSIGQIKSIIGGKEKEPKEMVEFLETTPVKVYKVKRMDFKDTLPVMGRIEGAREIELRFETNGIIESFNFEEGERILEGDIIASLNQKDALLKLKYAALEMEKAKKMFELGAQTKIAYDQKKLEYDSAKRDLEKTNIYASGDGYLGSKEKTAGSFVTSQDKIGSFVDFSEVFATYNVIEEDSHKVALGQNTEIFIDAYPGKTYNGTIDTISPVIEGRTRTQNVKIELKNDEDLLKPGMFARGIINTYEKKDAIMIPASAFKKKGQEYYVYVVHRKEGDLVEDDKAKEEKKDAAEENEGAIEERAVQIEYLTHDMAEIAKGLEEGELIVRELHQEYKDKDVVEITEVQETIF